MLEKEYSYMGGAHCSSTKMNEGGLQYGDVLVIVTMYTSTLVARDFVGARGRLCTYDGYVLCGLLLVPVALSSLLSLSLHTCSRGVFTQYQLHCLCHPFFF